MRLLTFRKHGELTTRIGAVSERGEVIDIGLAFASYLKGKGDPSATGSAQACIPMDMVEFINGGQAVLESAETANAHVEKKRSKGGVLGINSEKLYMSQSEIEFLPPILRPYKMISAAMNYREYLADSGRTAPEIPVAFL